MDERREFATVYVREQRRILILGWNHKVAAFLDEVKRYVREKFEITIMSLVPVTERETELNRRGIHTHPIRLTHREGDYTSPTELEAVKPGSYDNIIFVGSHWLETQEESDARTIIGHLALQNVLENAE